jgi:hypothetical protein
MKELEYYIDLIKKDSFNFYSKEAYQKLILEILKSWNEDKYYKEYE